MHVQGGGDEVQVDVVEGGVCRSQGFFEMDAAPNLQPRPWNFDIVDFQFKNEEVLLGVRKFWPSNNSGLGKCQYSQRTCLDEYAPREWYHDISLTKAISTSAGDGAAGAPPEDISVREN